MATINRTVTVTITADDYAVANKLFVLNSYKTRGAVAAMALVGLYILLLGASYAGYVPGIPRELIHSVMIGIVVATTGFSLVNYFVIAPYAARSTYRKQKTLHYPVTLSWSEAGLKAANANGEGTIPWSDYLKVAENTEVILIFQSPRLFQMLPKRTLDADQVDDLRQCAASAGL